MINDTLGHDIGDELLKVVAGRIKDSLRKEDTVARLGGDEFTILLEELSSPEDAASVAGKVIDSLSEKINIKDNAIFVTASVGISIFPDDGSEINELIKNADTAMYHAKEDGKNRYKFYTESLNLKISKRMHIENNLRRAIVKNELNVYYQPKIDLHTDKITSMEALVRWNSGKLGKISPADFIPVAEDTGFITAIGEWVLHEACQQTRLWHKTGYDHLSVAVNISSRQIRDKDFVDMIKNVLDETGLRPECLELEITESLLMQNLEKTVEKLIQLKELGVKFAIDDFGTGYSSMSYLRQLPIDFLKIDKSFIRDISSDKDDESITMATIHLAHNLGIKVIAEGVESYPQLEFLRKHGCDYVQGFLFYKPLTAEEFYGVITSGF